MADPQDWSIDSNEAVELALLNPLPSNPLTFHPDYTYPIFGEAETIYGYKDLSINLSFAGWDMKGYFKVSWRQRINPALGIEAEDIKETLKEYLPEDVFEDENDFQMYLANPNFKPPGQKVDEYTANGKTYMVYKSSLADSETVALVDRLQILILFYIEGGSYIDTSDDRWQIYILYEKKPSDEVPTIAGYATTYPYHYHQLTKNSPKLSDAAFCETVFNSSPSNMTGSERYRLRISQFLILPPFQRAGHGGKFYDIIFKDARANTAIQEISVEDPSAAFEDLRDRRDLLFLDENGVFNGLKAPVPKQWVEETRQRYKMPPRQFRRVLEMALLREINPHEESEEYKNWRLQVKQRLYNHNIDTLAQLQKAERFDKLQQTFKGVEDDYLRLLKMGSNGFNGATMDIDEDEDEDGEDVEEEEEEEDSEARPAKRVRIQ